MHFSIARLAVLTSSLFMLAASAIAEDWTSKEYKLRDGGTVKLEVPKSWQNEVQTDKRTILFTAPKGKPAFEFLITLLPPNPDSAMQVPDIRRTVESFAEKAKLQAVEKEIPVNELKGPSLLGGCYYSATDKAPKPGEWKYMTQGEAALEEGLVVFSVYMNDDSRDVSSRAIDAVQSIFYTQGSGREKERAASGEPKGDQVAEVLELIGRIGAKDYPADDMFNSLAEAIEKDRAAVSQAILPRIKEEGLSEKQLVVYLWALGQTRDRSATPILVGLYERTTSELVKIHCLGSLATIGGHKAGAFLMDVLNATTDKKRRLDILNWLGQMQYKPALPKMEEVLRQDATTLYWQSVFVFGKMGDKGVPFLLTKVADKDLNTRTNALSLLGIWLIPVEAEKPVRERFWLESDVTVRRAILASMERLAPDLNRLRTFCEQVVAKEKEESLVQFARETLSNINKMSTEEEAFARQKAVSVDRFQREYKKLFFSAGKEGDYERLSASSTVKVEPQLKALRERILQRNSDEAFYDYQKVTRIIRLNRLLAVAKEGATGQ